MQLGQTAVNRVFDILLLRSIHEWYDRRFDPLRPFLLILFVGIPLSFGFEGGGLNVWTLPPFIFAIWLSVTRVILMHNLGEKDG
jgi:hypothetical protein